MNKEYRHIEKQALFDLVRICVFLKIFYKAKYQFNRKVVIDSMMPKFEKLNRHSSYPMVTYQMLIDKDYEEEINKIIFESKGERLYESLCI